MFPYPMRTVEGGRRPWRRPAWGEGEEAAALPRPPRSSSVLAVLQPDLDGVGHVLGHRLGRHAVQGDLVKVVAYRGVRSAGVEEPRLERPRLGIGGSAHERAIALGGLDAAAGD